MIKSVVIASDSFKGSAESVTVAEALIRGWRRAVLKANASPAAPSATLAAAQSVEPSDAQGQEPEFTIIPMADGGEGTLDAFEYVWKDSQRMPLTVTGPSNKPVATYWLKLDESTALVELANTSGLLLADPLDPFHCHSLGFGEALAASLASSKQNSSDQHQALTVYAGIGGSASNDGGLGLLVALGVKFFDQDGTEILATDPDFGNAALARIASADRSALLPLPSGGIRVISDVTSPLLGPAGAAAVFGPQKGANSEDIPKLEHNLVRFAGILKDAFPNADPEYPGSGAAGGCGFALHAIGAELLPGSVIVSETLGLKEAIERADLVITGEGRFDAQSAQGKAVLAVKQLADDAGIGTVLVAGSIESSTEEFTAAFSLTKEAGSVDAALGETQHWLEVVGTKLAKLFPGGA